MATPVHILMAMTKEGLARYRSPGSKDLRGTKFGLGITERQVGALREGLAKHGLVVTGVETVLLGNVGLHVGRKQHHSKALLKMARDKAKAITDWHTKVLLITDADIYDTDTLFIAGQAEVNGRAAVVSIARLGTGDQGKFLRRLLKEALHELGHTLGLGHCRDHDCVMFMSRVLADSDVKDHEFCRRCRTKAGRMLSMDQN